MDNLSPRPTPIRPGPWNRFQQNKPALLSLVCLLALGSFILLWPVLSPQNTTRVTATQFHPPGPSHWCGTDVHGRDLLARMVYGAKISLLVGLVGAALSLVIGVAWGGLAGYVGGRCDGLMMRLVDILYSIPSIVFVTLFLTFMDILAHRWLPESGTSSQSVVLRLVFLIGGLGAISWLTMARIVRGQVLALRTQNFVEASRALGASHARILGRHILPNVQGIIIVYMTLTIPGIILYESFLSYLGLGIQPPMASWGSLIADGVQQLNSIRIYWWLIVFPAGMLVATLLALNFLGDGLRDALDPRSKG